MTTKAPKAAAPAKAPKAPKVVNNQAENPIKTVDGVEVYEPHNTENQTYEPNASGKKPAMLADGTYPKAAKSKPITADYVDEEETEE